MLRPSPPEASLSTASLEFAAQTIGAIGEARELRLQNLGGRAMRVEAVRLAGDGAADFRLAADGCGGTALPPARSCAMRIAFAPQASGARSATLEVESDARNGRQHVALAGQGLAPALALDRREFVFPQEPVGAASGPIPLTVRNRGSAPVRLSRVALEGSHSADFAVGSDRCSGRSLGVGQECSLRLSFRPQAVGDRRASLRILGDGVPDEVVQLAGRGTEEPPRAELDRQSLDFGTLAVGEASAPRSVRLKNAGRAPLRVGEISLAGGAGFAVQREDCSARSLAAGTSCSLSVVFRPAREGALSDSLELPGVGQRVALTGNGALPRLVLAAERLDFSAVRMSAAAERRLEVENRGSAPLRVRRVEIEGQDVADFAVADNGCAGRALARGESCAMALRFRPSREGLRSAVVVLDHNGPAGPARVAVEGVGLPAPAAEASASPAALDFGALGVGLRSPIRTVTVRNSGSAALVLEEVAVIGSGRGSFPTVPGSCAGAPYLVPGSECTIGLRFVPTAEGRQAASLLLRHNGADAETRVSLAGTGLPR